MYEPLCRVIVDALVRHGQSFEGIRRFKSWTYRPSHYLMGIKVCYERQVAYALIGLDIRNIACPYLVGMVWYDILYEIGILAVVMLGIRCLIASPAFHPHHKPMLAEHFDKAVTARETARFIKHLFQYGMKLGCTESWVGLAIFTCLLHDDRLDSILSKAFRIIALVVRLPAVTKQSAESAQTCA